MSQRSHIASSGSTAICECSARAARRAAARAGTARGDQLVELVPQRLGGERRRAAGRAPGSRSPRGRAAACAGRRAPARSRDSSRTTASRRAPSRRSSRRSICVSVSRLGCVYQLPSNGSTSARRPSRSSSQHLVGAPHVQVDRALVHGGVGARRPRPCRAARPSSRRPARTLSAEAERSDDARRRVVLGAAQHERPSARSRRSPRLDEHLGVLAPARPEDLASSASLSGPSCAAHSRCAA